jgi:hypothetical protein
MAGMAIETPTLNLVAIIWYAPVNLLLLKAKEKTDLYRTNLEPN